MCVTKSSGPRWPTDTAQWHHPVPQGGSLPLPRSLRALLSVARSAFRAARRLTPALHRTCCGARPLGTRRIFPRKKSGESCRTSSDPIVMTREMLSRYFDRPLRQAAVDLGISPTALKSLCRKLEVLLLPPALCCTRSPPRVRCSSACPERAQVAVRLWRMASCARTGGRQVDPVFTSFALCVIGRFPGGPSRKHAG